MTRPAWLLCVMGFAIGCGATAPPTPAPVANSPTPVPAAAIGESETEKAAVTPDESSPPPTPVIGEDEALEAMASLSAAELTAKLQDQSQRDLAIRTLVGQGAAAVAELLKALASDEPQVRAAAAFALGQIDSAGPEARQALSAMAKEDPSELARGAAAFAIDALDEE